MNTVKFASFSSIREFERCPYAIYLGRILRSERPVPREDSPLVRGERVHKDAELFIKGEGELTRELKKFEAEFKRLKEKYAEGTVECEKTWCFTSKWEPCSWDDKAWIIKCDAVEKLDDRCYRVIDFKTGKSWGKEVAHTQQMQLYAIGTLMLYPEAHIAKASLWYTDEGKETERTYTRENLAYLLTRYDERAKKLINATNWPAKPNKGNCRWCDFGVDVGTGVCSYAISGSK